MNKLRLVEQPMGIVEELGVNVKIRLSSLRKEIPMILHRYFQNEQELAEGIVELIR